MKLIENDGGHSAEFGVDKQAAGEHAFSGELQASLWRGVVFEADLVSNGRANRLAQFFRHAAGRHPGCDAAGFENHHLTHSAEQCRWSPCGLPRPRRGFDDQVHPRLQESGNPRNLLVDREDHRHWAAHQRSGRDIFGTAAMQFTRRGFLATTALSSASLGLAQKKDAIPVGLEMYSVRKALQADLMGTIKTVCDMGYQDVEFFAPYYQWTHEQAKDVRKLLDDKGVKCLSTHNAFTNYKAENIQKAIDLNHILGTRFVVIASAGRAQTLDDWKKIADGLAEGAGRLRSANLRGGYHNHQAEFTALEGKRPIEVIAANTPKDFMLQFDVGTCIEMGSDPVAWINANPGRINSLHLKDWNKAKGYRTLTGEGDIPWKPLFAAAEKTGGVEFYLIEQEGSDFSEFETAQKCLDAYRKLRAAA